MNKIKGDGGEFSCGGVEGCVEKAYNSNWITIKIKKQIKTKKVLIKKEKYFAQFTLDWKTYQDFN